MHETDKNDGQTMRCWSKRIVKTAAQATAFVCLSFSASFSFADALPPEFQGRWMVYSDKSPEDKCEEAEGITVSRKTRV
jgi:hypothetical protein